jgi:HAD superfamily hydrolase (TIGR01549 family)
MFFESVILDLDNTLYDYDVCHNTAIDKVLKDISTLKKIPLKEIRNLYDRAKKAIKSEINETASAHNKFLYFKKMSECIELDVLQTDKKYWKLFYKNMVLREGALDFLRFLKSKNIKIHILTDFLAKPQYIKLKKLKISSYIKTITTSEEIGAEKPSSKTFFYCIERIKTPISKILFIGDDLNRDITGSIKRGIFPIWLNPTVSNNMILQDCIICKNFKFLFRFFNEISSKISALEGLSKYCGERFDLVQSGGGNISIKTNSDLMMIKASGYSLSDVSKTNGYTIINNKNLKKDLLKNQYNDLSDYNVFGGDRASIETYMHAILKKYTIHLHPIQINKLLIEKNSATLIEEIFPESYIMDYKTPGIDTCKKIAESYKGEKVIFIINHGLIITTDSYSESIALIKSTITKCEKLIGYDFKKYKMTNVISRAVNSATNEHYVTKLSEDSVIIDLFIKNPLSFRATFPDKSVFCGVNFLKTNKLSKPLIKGYALKNKGVPKIIVFENNVYTVAKSLAKCNDIESILKAHLMVLDGAVNCNFLPRKDEYNLSKMKAEKYRENHVHSA